MICYVDVALMSDSYNCRQAIN